MAQGQPLWGGDTNTRDNLLAGGELTTKSVTLAAVVGAADTYAVRGRVMARNSAGKYVGLDDAETTIPISATGEVIANNLLAASGLAPIPFALSKPPIPGTVTLVTTADGSATTVLALGTDNGLGVGVGAGGRFTIDYVTGQGIAYPGTAATNGDDLKAGFKHRSVAGGGQPEGILILNETGANIAAGDTINGIYVAGKFNSDALKGYSAGYEMRLRELGIFIVDGQ